jgi:penicillin amidase
VEAYAAGINAFVTGHMRARPPEFLILGLQPSTWEPEDSLAWAIMMAWDLGGNWSTELARMRLSLTLSPDRIQELFPPYPGEQPLPLPDYGALYRELKVDGQLGRQAEALLRAAPPSGIEGVGSNNWVVAGSHSETGQPLLANDPHLKLSAPALWYFARLEAPGLKVAGATMPGLPMVVLGQNEHIAWGFTNTGPDVQDLYLEQILPEDPGRYRTPDGSAAFETWEETIAVKGKAPVKMTVRATRHGPVISDAATEATRGLTGPAGQPGYAIAMRWTALDEPSTTLEAGLAFNRARSVDEFLKASERYLAPMQNMVVADGQRIAFVAAGRVPVRKAENDLRGQVPAPGWDPRYDWAGYLDPAQTPREVDPPRGWIATANQRIHPADYPHYLTSEWTLPYRQQRIEDLLAARPRHTLDSLAGIQADQFSLAAVKLLPHLRQARSTHPLAEQAYKVIAAFDGTMAADQPGPLIYWAWVRHLTHGLLADEVGAAHFERLLGQRNFRDAVEGILERGDIWWCDDKTTPDVAETCQQQLDSALTRALHELQQAHGSNVGQWRWGDAHQTRAEHRPFSRVKLLAPLFELRAPAGGDTYTVNVSRVNMRADPVTGEYYLNEHGPSLRALYDLQDRSRSRFMHSSGQSGIVLSPHYRSFLGAWSEVRYVPVWPVQEDGQVLVLTPR